jgi:hypothetical protein
MIPIGFQLNALDGYVINKNCETIMRQFFCVLKKCNQLNLYQVCNQPQEISTGALRTNISTFKRIKVIKAEVFGVCPLLFGVH